MSFETRSKLDVHITVPPWLAATAESCEILEGAKLVFGHVLGIESALKAAFTAMGYELCAMAYEAFDCNESGRLMLAQLHKDTVTLSLITTPIMVPWLTFQATKTNGEQDLHVWINQFVDSNRPDLAMISSSDVLDAAYLRRVLLQTRAGKLLIDQSPTFYYSVLSMGAAKAAKDILESPGTDCFEWDECLDIHREADRIAGKYNPIRPATWPDVASSRNLPCEAGEC